MQGFFGRQRDVVDYSKVREEIELPENHSRLSAKPVNILAVLDHGNIIEDDIALGRS